MREMSESEWRAFVSEGTRTGKLAVVLPDGSPSVSPIWFLLGDDGVFRLTTMGDSDRAAAIRHQPLVSMVVDDETPPYSFVRVRASATIVDDRSAVRDLATRIGARYMGVDRAEEFGRRNGVAGEVIVELRPSRVTAKADVAD